MSITKLADGRLVQATQETPSRRKPHSWWAGYVTERRNVLTGDHDVLVNAIAQGLDPAGGPWVTICNAHGNLVNHTSLRTARAFLKAGAIEWCDECQKQAKKGGAK